MASNEEVKSKVIKAVIDNFKAKKEKGAPINKYLFTFWAKLKKMLPQDVVDDVERHPEKEETVKNFDQHLSEKFQNNRVVLHAVMFIQTYEGTVGDGLYN